MGPEGVPSTNKLGGESEDSITEGQNTSSNDDKNPALIGIKETGYSAIPKISALTGVDSDDLHRAFNSACVGENDPVGSGIDALTIWKYYLNNHRKSAEESPSQDEGSVNKPSEKRAGDSYPAAEGTNNPQELIYSSGLDQIESGQKIASIDPSFFKLNHGHTVKYLEMVISKSENPATRARAKELLVLQNKIAEDLGIK